MSAEDEEDDGLYIGFEHRMNRDERRKMRERERKHEGDPTTTTASSSSSRRSRGSNSHNASSSSRYAHSSPTVSSSKRLSSEETGRSSRRSASGRDAERRERKERSSRGGDDRHHHRGSDPHHLARRAEPLEDGPSERERPRERRDRTSRSDRSPRRKEEKKSTRKHRERIPENGGGSSRRTAERRRSRGDEDDEERRKRREERRAREREERRAREGRRAAKREAGAKSDDDTNDRAERERLREERRRARERERERERERGGDDDRAYRQDRERRRRDRERESRRRDESDGAPKSARTLDEQLERGNVKRDETSTAGRSRDTESSSAVRSRLRDRMLGDDDVKSKRLTDTSQEDDANVISGSIGPSSSSSESEDLFEIDVANEDNEESSVDDGEDKWTVRVCLISAIDLPFNVVQNVPLCPVLKFGLVNLPEEEKAEANDGEETAASRESSVKSPVSKQIEENGLLSIPKSRVRCTSSKILSKRDNGQMEFHEEMRWDNVKRPTTTALAVELCARAAFPPKNASEGPVLKDKASAPGLPGAAAGTASDGAAMGLPASFDRGKAWAPGAAPAASQEGDDNDDIFLRAMGRRPGDTIANAARTQTAVAGQPGPDSGIDNFMAKYRPNSDKPEEQLENPGDQPVAGMAGMRALWMKGRQQFERRQNTRRQGAPNEMEAATAAAAVAKFLIGGGNEGEAAPQEAAPNTDSLDRKQVGLATEFRRDAFGAPAAPTGGGPSATTPPFAKRALHTAPQQTDENVALIKPNKRQKLEMADDLRLGSLVIPLTRLPLTKATNSNEAARIEQWYQLDQINNMLFPSQPPARRGLAPATQMTARKNPSVLLEISFSSPQILDESEDELEIDSETEEENNEQNGDNADGKDQGAVSFSRRTSVELRATQKAQEAGKKDDDKPSKEEKKKVNEDPVLEPGVVDFIAVVGAGNIGNISGNSGEKGWVDSHPECTILEQFPPDDEFHHSKQRNVTLNNKAEWFSFPEGCRLWRGAEPPSHMDLNLKRFSASSPPNVASSIAAFDACLNCTTSFSWFVIQSNEKENDFKNTKTYGAAIKFYAPAPEGVDSSENTDAPHDARKRNSAAKRLWVPLGILMTSNLPIVGTLEAMLLRLCESLASQSGGALHMSSHQRIQQIIHQDLANVICNFQKPISGVLHCSVPFLTGERLHLTVPPPTGLPPLPHGGSVTSVCRLLGSEGLNVLLAAALTESKILIHSDEISNLAMVAEVVTALIYPFVWSLPYLPVLPEAMLEFVEAPLSYFIGIPSCNMKMIDESILADIVVVDLDNGFTAPDYYDGGRRGARKSKTPTPLPASVASNISKAVFRLLREEEEVEEEFAGNNFPGARSLPRLEAESLAERDFRIAIALQICGLVRGYDDCLFKVSASQPVFNRDKFLRIAPALFEDRKGNLPTAAGPGSNQPQKMLSPRSKRFLSIMVNCQHFHQFLESLDSDECAFFNEVMYTFDMHEERRDHDAGAYASSRLEEAAAHLSKALQKVEDKIPTYRVERKEKKKRRGGSGWDDDDDDDGGIEDLIEAHDVDHDIGFSDDGNLISSFTNDLLQPTGSQLKTKRTGSDDEGSHNSEPHNSHGNSGANEKSGDWDYRRLFDINMREEDGKKMCVEIREKVKLRDAIGERRYRAWKVAQEQKNSDKDGAGRMFTGDVAAAEGNTALDLNSLLSHVTDDAHVETASCSPFGSQQRKITNLTPEQQRVADAKDRDVLRRCLEKAYEGGNQRRPARYNRRPSDKVVTETFFENGRDLIADAEAALRNPSAQKFLVSVLSQRSRLETPRKRRGAGDDKRRGANQSTMSRLEPPAFDCLVRLCCAMLDACLEAKNYESAYGLLTQTQGFCSVQSKDGKPLSKKESELDVTSKLIYMTTKISLHPIFAELELWEGVLQLHLEEREKERKDDDSDSKDPVVEKDADLAAYETTVSTLYEMLGYGLPSEELARFATLVSEKRGWFQTERGHSLLMLARRVSVKRENGNDSGHTGDFDMIRAGMNSNEAGGEYGGTNAGDVGKERFGRVKWSVIGWCHPAAGANRVGPVVPATIPGAPNTHGAVRGDQKNDENTADRFMRRSPVTSLAAFGSSIVASGGLDGSVFVAHTIQFASDENNQENENVVRGVRLDWGSSGSRSTVVGNGSSSMDGEYGVGAVSCLAAAKGAGYRNTNLTAMGGSVNRDVAGKNDDDEILHAMEGCRVVAGTTGGDLRVWSVKDVYAATVLAKKGDSKDVVKPTTNTRISHGGEDGGVTATFVPRNKRGSITEIAAGTAFSRLKFSLRGRALSGHRGGVSCVDVPSHIYRPDALVTGGADGFIKLWSLRTPTGRRTNVDISTNSNSLFNTNLVGGNSNGNDPLSQTRTKGSRGGDALSILSGHNGRVLCVKTAWHGDKLLSGGADRTVRIWDLAIGGGGGGGGAGGGSGSGKCLQALSGHLGWVTRAQYWGQNTIVSASTDRAIALWDARVRKSPLFVLRYHKSPISDLLVGSRTDPLMVSAGADGTVATWDFRAISGANGSVVPAVAPEDGKSGGTTTSAPVTTDNAGGKQPPEVKQCKAIRTPAATMTHCAEGRSTKQSGAVLLSRGTGRLRRTVLSVGVDAVAREWDVVNGTAIRADLTGHADAVSCLHAFSDGTLGSGVEPGENANFGGFITSSWDGTIRLRKLLRK